MRFDTVGMATNVLTAMLVDLSGDSTFTIPGRQYVSAGADIAFDCEELVVHGIEITSVPTPATGEGPERTREDVRFLMSMMVTVVRCQPLPQSENELLSATVLDTAGRQMLGDGGALLRAAMGAWQRGALLPSCSDIMIGPVAWANPEGGLSGTTLNIRAQL